MRRSTEFSVTYLLLFHCSLIKLTSLVLPYNISGLITVMGIQVNIVAYLYYFSESLKCVLANYFLERDVKIFIIVANVQSIIKIWFQKKKIGIVYIRNKIESLEFDFVLWQIIYILRSNMMGISLFNM